MLVVFDVYAADGAHVGRYFRLNEALSHKARTSGSVKIGHSDQSFDPEAWDSSLPLPVESVVQVPAEVTSLIELLAVAA